MRTASFITAFFLLTCASNAQLFQKVIFSDSYEQGNALDVFDGGNIIAGRVTDSAFYFAPYLLKTDAAGNPLWNKLYRYGQSGNGIDVIAASDGGFVFTGTFSQFAGEDTTFLLKTDANGNLLWSKLFYIGQGEECIPASLMETTDGGYLITGVYRNQINFDNDELFLFKTDANGNLLWAKTYDDGIDSYIYGKGTVEDNSGNIIVAAKNHLFSEGQLFMKTDSAGTIQTMRVYKAPGMTSTFPIHISKRQDSSYDLVFAERFASDSNHLLVIHADAAGVLLDALKYSVLNQSGLFLNVHKISDTELLASGYFAPDGTFNPDAVLLKADVSNGAVSWVKAYGSSGYESASDVKNRADGSFVLTGVTQVDSIFKRGGVPTDIYYLNTDVNGNVACNGSSLTAVSENFAMTDSAYSLIETDVTNSAYYEDFTPLELNFYRDTTVCLGTGMTEPSSENKNFILYPNPTSGALNIQGLTFNDGDALRILDMLGREVYCTKFHHTTSNFKLQTSNFENGVYVVQVQSGEKIATRKLIVQK